MAGGLFDLPPIEADLQELGFGPLVHVLDLQPDLEAVPVRTAPHDPALDEDRGFLRFQGDPELDLRAGGKRSIDVHDQADAFPGDVVQGNVVSLAVQPLTLDLFDGDAALETQEFPLVVHH